MLVLSRRVGESIMIGHDVVVTVLEVRPDLVRIGINAPREVEVHREEVFIEVQRANLSAASPPEENVAALAAGIRDAEQDGAKPAGAKPVDAGPADHAGPDGAKPAGAGHVDDEPGASAQA